MEALIYFALWAGLIFLMMRFGCGKHIMGHGHDGARNKRAPQHSNEVRWVPPEADVDPVCGKTVRTNKAKSAVHDGTVYYFCSPEHRETFEAAPHRYIGPQAGQQPKQTDHDHG